ncbi:MAG: sulfotransferase domain-containing protein [Phycisphaerales bacterium]
MAPPKPIIHLAIVGMARSGTTMLSDLLTDPPAKRVCLTEPRLHSNKPYRRGKRTYFDSIGFEGAAAPKDVVARLGEMERVGVKEVRKRNIKRMYKQFDVRKTIVIVRDARACLLSYHTKHSKSDAKHKKFPGKLFIRTSRIIDELLSSLPEDRVRLVRYEEFVKDESMRESLEEWLDWPLSGDVSAIMKTRRGRGTEVERHSGVVSAASVGREETPPTPEQRVELEPVLRKIESFQTRFGYPTRFASSPEGD